MSMPAKQVDLTIRTFDGLTIVGPFGKNSKYIALPPVWTDEIKFILGLDVGSVIPISLSKTQAAALCRLIRDQIRPQELCSLLLEGQSRGSGRLN